MHTIVYCLCVAIENLTTFYTHDGYRDRWIYFAR